MQSNPGLGAGSAVVNAIGVYTDVVSRHYITQIDGVSGSGPNQGTFRWSDDGGATFPPGQTNIPITAGALNPLSHGIYVVFIPGPTEPQYVLGDTAQFTVIRQYSVSNLTDLQRDYEFRSSPVASGSTFNLPYDLGVQRTPTVAVLDDHNLLSSTTIRLQSSESSAFSGLEYNQVVPWADKRLVYYLTSPTSARYWRWNLTVGSASQVDIRIGEWYLGDYLQMAAPSFDLGFSEEDIHFNQADDAQLARGPVSLSVMPTQFDLVWGQSRLAQDVATINTLRSLTNHESSKLRRPFWVHHDVARPIFELVQWKNNPRRDNRFLDVFSMPLSLLTLVRTLA